MKKTTHSLLNSLILKVFFIVCWLAASSPQSLAHTPESNSKSSNAEAIGTFASFSPKGDIRRFAGETLFFEMDYMIFTKAAQAQISFYEENGKFKSILVAETKGIVGFLTSYVKHVYKSTFDIIDDGNRLRTALFEREIIVGDRRERVVHAMDYASMRHRWFLYENDTLVNQFNESIAGKGHLDDVLGLFYNFRNGVYGKIEKGQNYTIPTFWTKSKNEKEISPMQIYVTTDSERRKYEEEEGGGQVEGATMLAKMKVPSDLFDTKKGDEYFWSSKHFIPLEAVYKDFILFGDLHIKLVKQVAPGRKQDTSKCRSVKLPKSATAGPARC
jgi:hypothetical protein